GGPGSEADEEADGQCVDEVDEEPAHQRYHQEGLGRGGICPVSASTSGMDDGTGWRMGAGPWAAICSILR
ncbi:hypothetical protein R0G64_32260, partial [Pseudomonas otitidis]|nr:hypothetical protein [Pseudomonas otitidis]